ncbi:MAG: transglycosylase domain-containing protein [Dehalococcoidia bacterium]
MNTLEKRRLLHRRRTARRGAGAARWFIIALLGLSSLAAIGAAAGLGTLYGVYRHYSADYVPIETKLRQTNVGLTEIFDRNGIRLGALENRDAQLLAPVPLEQISNWVIEATISTEDDSFWDNPGVNWRGLVRAAKENYIDGHVASGTGGSSITQQLIKNVYICPNIALGTQPTCQTAERTLDRKLREIAYALELEQDYTKEQILSWYLNQISYADRYIGIEAAAQGYFHKPAANLTLAEAALLAGVPAFPDRYHPRKPENCLKNAQDQCITDGPLTTVAGEAKKRQEFVLDLMVEHKRLSRAEADAAKAEVLKVYASANPIRGDAFIDNQVEPRLVRMCSAGILPNVEGATCEETVHAAGWRVTTTIDIKETELAQEIIRGAIEKGVEDGCNCFNAAIATIDPPTGEIIVYAANRDPTFNSDARVRGNIDQLTEINQPGSSFKPVVYLTWFDKLGKAPMSTLWDTSPLTIDGVAITNPRSGEVSEGMISARAALGGSQNVGAFRAAAEAGVDNVIDMANRMGITTLAQGFDPTFNSHEDVEYGASIATGGANIRAIDMAYMNAVIANMGVMVGVPSYAEYKAAKDYKSFDAEGAGDRRLADLQFHEFSRGNLRLKGSRELDPVVVLQVRDNDGTVLYDHAAANDLQRKQVVDAGSVWLVHSIIADCSSRFIIWGCGGSNDDLALDPFVDGVRIPGGAKTGTQQGPLNAQDTLETWMNGYSRYAGTALWVGNANNELVRDGPGARYAAANTTVRLFKRWMGEYHSYLKRVGVITGPLLGFDELRPKNVAQVSFPTTATDRGLKGGCEQTVSSWVRTDVKYESECDEVEVDSRNLLLVSDATPQQFRVKKGFVKLPLLKPDLAKELAKEKKIPIAPKDKSTGAAAVSIGSPSNGRNVSGLTPVIASVAVTEDWLVELGEGAAPAAWKKLGAGKGPITDATVGSFDTREMTEGVYTVRLTAGQLSTSVTFNVRRNTTGAIPSGSDLQPQPQTPVPGGR